jgi:hypothetical protein
MASAAQVRILPLSRDFFFAAARRPGHIFCASLPVSAESVESSWRKHVEISPLGSSHFRKQIFGPENPVIQVSRSTATCFHRI